MISKKVFIDCGAHKATSLDFFMENFSDSGDYETHSFEINSDFSKYFDKYTNEKSHFFYNLAVWTNDGEVSFWKMPEESSTVSKYHPRDLGDTAAISKCLDFSTWMRNTFSDNDYIILKMYIEGAEFEVLPKMIKDGTLGMVDELYIEFHYKKRNNTSLELSSDILLSMIFDYGLEPRRWDATGSDMSTDKVGLDWRFCVDIQNQPENSELGKRWKKIKNHFDIDTYIKGKTKIFIEEKRGKK
jgi:FkbM family methyltransferase